MQSAVPKAAALFWSPSAIQTYDQVLPYSATLILAGRVGIHLVVGPFQTNSYCFVWHTYYTCQAKQVLFYSATEHRQMYSPGTGRVW